MPTFILKYLLFLFTIFSQGLLAQEVDFSKRLTQNQKERIYTTDFYSDAIATGDLSNDQINQAIKWNKKADFLTDEIKEQDIKSTLETINHTIIQLHKNSIPQEYRDELERQGFNKLEKWNQHLIQSIALLAGLCYNTSLSMPDDLIPFSILTDKEALAVRKELWKRMVYTINKMALDNAKKEQADEADVQKERDWNRKNAEYNEKQQVIDKTIEKLDRSQMIFNQRQILQNQVEQNQKIQNINSQLIYR
jgi:hypothetical protein